MKNKGLTYALVIVVGVIWYNVYHRVVTSLTSDASNIVSDFQERQSVFLMDRDTFLLHANYRDPFSGAKQVPIGSEGGTNMRRKLPVKKSQPMLMEPWPDIRYKGQLRKTSSNNPLAILSIDGILLQMRSGERVFDGITIQAIGRDSVVVLYQRELRVFHRE